MWRLVCEAFENRENACPGTPHTNGRVPPFKKKIIKVVHIKNQYKLLVQ